MFNFSFLSISNRGIDSDYCDTKWLALEMNRDNSVVFEIASKYCISDSFVGYDGYSISELNSPIPVHFSSLIPKMSTFMLVISCLTTSNLP